MTKSNGARLAWAVTGSGHFLKESLDLAAGFEDTDLFLSEAAAEVLHMYDWDLERLRGRFRVFRDNTASAAPVGLFYHSHYHTLVVAPATSNSVAKCVAGISDTLVTNIYAQAGKCRIQSIVFACDTEPVVTTEAPDDWVTLYPRRIDLDNAQRLAGFEYTSVVTSVAELRSALQARLQCLDRPVLASCS